MPATIPEDLVDLLTSDVLATVAAQRPDGSIALYLMWIDHEGGRLLTSSRVGSRKAENWQRNPTVSVSAVDHADPWRFLILRGRVVGTRPDEGLAFIDKLSVRYLGALYRMRNFEREIFEIEIDHVQASGGRG
ncbi:MAG: pyridoxamine 5'-phosphate oxidase family protein [Chloroflexota bacterium]|nr:pyridoxamine 5'-phosphate oxidase family protein [Chloroflexota bacterium]